MEKPQLLLFRWGLWEVLGKDCKFLFDNVELVISIESTSNEERIRPKSLESVLTEMQGMRGGRGEKGKEEKHVIIF